MLRRLLLPSLVLVTLPAWAANFGFEAEGVRSNRGGLLVPCIRVGLHAMNSERGIEQSMSTDEYGRPVITVVNQGNAWYTLYLGVADDTTGQPLRILPPGPCRSVECMNRDYINLVALAADGTPIVIRATVTSRDGSLDPSSIYAFNPQPEPPGDFPAPMRVDFRLRALDAATTASITLSVISGNVELALE